MLAWYMLSSCVRLSVTSQHCTTMAKCRIMQTTLYDSPKTLVFDAKDLSEILMGSPPTETPSRGRVGSNRQFSTNISLYLKNGAIYGHSYYGMLIETCTRSIK